MSEILIQLQETWICKGDLKKAEELAELIEEKFPPVSVTVAEVK